MPKQNRPLVKDGRLQAKKKRTERSYLGTATGEAITAFDPPVDEAAEIDETAELAETPEAIAPDAFAMPTPAAAAPAPIRSAAATAAPRPPRLPTAARAIQQQGIRKRRDVDLGALGRRDTAYALHEMRRIAVLATMVVVTLVILWFFLRY